MKNKKTYIILASVAVLALVAYFLFGGEKHAGVTYGTAEVKVGDITNSVTATGTIEPVTSVTVGTQVSGKVAHLYVDYNSHVCIRVAGNTCTTREATMELIAVRTPITIDNHLEGIGTFLDIVVVERSKRFIL